MPRKLMNAFEPRHGFTRRDFDAVADNPPLSDDRLKAMRPFAEALPDLAENIKRTRGKQKTPTKQLVSLRIDREVLAAFKAEGAGWQSRINATLRRAAKRKA